MHYLPTSLLFPLLFHFFRCLMTNTLTHNEFTRVLCKWESLRIVSNNINPKINIEAKNFFHEKKNKTKMRTKQILNEKLNRQKSERNFLFLERYVEHSWNLYLKQINTFENCINPFKGHVVVVVVVLAWIHTRVLLSY